MNQTEAMVMEKKSPGLMSTLTNTAVRVKRSRMTSRLPRIRTISGMLFGKGEGRVDIAGLRPGKGRRAKSFLLGLDAGAGERRRGREGRMGGLPSGAQMELPRQRGRGPRGRAWD